MLKVEGFYIAECGEERGFRPGTEGANGDIRVQSN